MSVLIISKTSFNQIQIDNVTNIAYAGGNYVITAGSTSTYSASDYNIAILFKEV